MEPSQNTISLKMIPRIDLDRIKARMSMVRVVVYKHDLIKRVSWPKAHFIPHHSHRKTGLQREKSSRDHRKDSLTLRRSGKRDRSVSVGASLASCVFSDAVTSCFCFILFRNIISKNRMSFSLGHLEGKLATMEILWYLKETDIVAKASSLKVLPCLLW